MKKLTATAVAAVAALALIPSTSYAWRCGILRPFCGRRAAYRASFYQSGARVGVFAASDCSGGACYVSTPAPCDPVGACGAIVSTPAACENGACELTPTIPAPCDPVAGSCEIETAAPPAPCEPVGACAPVSGACENGACPLDASTCKPCAPGEYYPTGNGGDKLTVAINELIEIVNETRARYGVATLRNDATLEAGAIRQARYCAYSGRLTHGAGVAEILAQNTQGLRVALRQWLESPAHRSVLLNGGYRYAGVAVVRDNQGRAWCAVRFR